MPVALENQFRSTAPANQWSQSPLKVAAICYRLNSDDEVEFLLVRTARGRWTFPKGGVDGDPTGADAAAREAYEEAGVRGKVEPSSFTRYLHHKQRLFRRSQENGVAVEAYLCEVVQLVATTSADLDKYKGKLAGKIVLFGAMRPVPPVDKALFERYTDQELAEMAEYPVNAYSGNFPPEMQARMRERMERLRLIDKIAQFFADEKVAAVIEPSRDAKNGGGSGGTLFDDNGATLGRTPYLADKAVKIPVVVAAIESYGRLYRLTEAHAPVSVQIDVETKTTGDHEHGFDTVAEIPGTDPKLKDQVVMLGGHLDSWIAGTGATDNGAGTIVAMEAVRILKALDIKPRRTIRIALWTGEEEGLFGSKGYCTAHFGSAKLSTTPEQMQLPEFMRRAVGPLEVKPEQKLISAYFNVDNGSGKIRGIYTQGNAAVAPIFAQWIAPLKDLGVSTVTMRNTGGTDHLSFDAVGIPGFQFIQDPLDYESRTHHSNQDVVERLQAADLKQIATVEAIFVYNAAQRDQMMPRKPLPQPDQEEKRRAPLDIFPGAVPPEKK